MNPFTLRFLWKGLSGRSMVFSLLFATAILGYSGAGFIRSALGSVGIPWWIVWIIPFILIGTVAKKEEAWFPRERFRKIVSYSVIAFSIVLSYLLWKIDSATPEYESSEEPRFMREQAGPRGK